MSYHPAGRGWRFFPRKLRLTWPMQKGKDVARWQAHLRYIGLRIHADGYFGPDTERATKVYQTGHYRPDVGVVDRWFRYKMYLARWLFALLTGELNDGRIHSHVSTRESVGRVSKTQSSTARDGHRSP